MLIQPYYQSATVGNGPAFYQEGKFQASMITIGLLTMMTGLLTTKVAYEGLGKFLGLLGVLGLMGGFTLFLITKVFA